MKIETCDTTLRDGAQGAGVSFTDKDKLKIIAILDALGITYIEAGNFDAGDLAFISRAAAEVKTSEITAFGATRRPGTRAEDDVNLAAAARSSVRTVCVYGKAWLLHVRDILRTTPDENIEMVRDTVSFLKRAGKFVLFDAEHFFDGYAGLPEYALSVVETAYEAGADRIILCDTNGGMLPDVIGMTVAAVKKRLPDAPLGIHTHNDLGMAVACASSAVLSGASHIQGTMGGIGERCGNANLCTLIPLLQLKLGFGVIPPERLSSLTESARAVCELANLAFDEHAPFVGGYAFAHKAGAHIDAALKDSASQEHISPSLVGNERNLLASGLSGRAAMCEKLTALTGAEFDKASPEVAAAVKLVKEAQRAGFTYDNAEASLALLMLGSLSRRRSFFRLKTFKVIVGENGGEGDKRAPASPESSDISAMVKIAVGDREEITAAEGDGPVHALDLALRRALVRFYPSVADVRLTDYKVRVIDSGEATRSVVRVLVESTDGRSVWRTAGVSADIIDASWQALRDSFDYKLQLIDGQ